MLNEPPLVTVVIPTYNHLRFLPDAIQSVRRQTYDNVEIIVIDDGSTDGTRNFLSTLNGIQVVSGPNKGLPHARNRGLDLSNGEYIVFLDADDLLFPDAVSTGLEEIRKAKEAAFVYGMFDIVNSTGEIIDESRHRITSGHYLHLFYENFISMTGSVLFRRDILKKFRFETSKDIEGCEDYDLYLRITRNYDIQGHSAKVARYRMHDNNMSGNAALILNSILHVQNRQLSALRNEDEKHHWKQGRETIINDYLSRMIQKNSATSDLCRTFMN